LARFVCGSCVKGGASAIDCDIFGEKLNPADFLNAELFANIDNKEKFLDYENLVEIGKKYPKIVEGLVGENRCLYT